MERHLYPTSIVDPTAVIGERTKIWHYCNIMRNVRIGDGCMIGSYVQLDPETIIGSHVRIQPFSAITGEIGNGSFIGPYVVFIDAKYPPGKTKKRMAPKIGNNVMIGAGSIIMPIQIEDGAIVSAGSLVTRNVPLRTWVQGQPARIRGNQDDYEARRARWNV